MKLLVVLLFIKNNKGDMDTKLTLLKSPNNIDSISFIEKYIELFNKSNIKKQRILSYDLISEL